jgi:hypothetical protein
VNNAKRVGTGDADPLLNGTFVEFPSDSTPAIATQAIAGNARRAATTSSIAVVISSAGVHDRAWWADEAARSGSDWRGIVESHLAVLAKLGLIQPRSRQ